MEHQQLTAAAGHCDRHSSLLPTVVLLLNQMPLFRPRPLVRLVHSYFL